MPNPTLTALPSLTLSSPLSATSVNPMIVAYGTCSGMTSTSTITCTLTVAGTSTDYPCTIYSHLSLWKVTINSGLANGVVVGLAVSSPRAATQNANTVTIDSNTPVGVPPAGT